MPKKKNETKVLVKRKETLPTEMDFARDAGGGLEEADAQSYAIPFLVVLQKGSPQCDEDHAACIPKAKPGMFFNTATNEIFDGAKGVVVVPAHFRRRYTEWIPREEGGGYRGEHLPDTVDRMKLERGKSGRMLLDNGNELADTRYHFCVLLTDEGPQPVVISMTSTQIKKSRGWMTKMNNLKLEGKDGKRYTPPTFSHAYRLMTVSENNDLGSWKGFQIELDHCLTAEESVIYAFAKEFKAQVESGLARVEEPVGDDDNDKF